MTSPGVSHQTKLRKKNGRQTEPTIVLPLVPNVFRHEIHRMPNEFWISLRNFKIFRRAVRSRSILTWIPFSQMFLWTISLNEKNLHLFRKSLFRFICFIELQSLMSHELRLDFHNNFHKRIHGIVVGGCPGPVLANRCVETVDGNLPVRSFPQDTDAVDMKILFLLRLSLNL